MTYQKYIFTLVYLCLCTISHVTSQDQACDKSTCKGPIKYCEDLGCIPTYGVDSCCPVKYNCDHLKGRAEDKCYYKGHVYNLGEPLREEDKKPCDIGCYCSPGYKSPAKFSCAVVDCFARPEPGCYLKKAHNQCCDGPTVCPRNNTEIAKCEVDGKTYLDGQTFTPESDPTLSCICGEGYTGENVAPFCKTVDNSFSCDVELRHSNDIYHNCIPAFYSSQNPATDCNYFSRCQNNDDLVVKSEDATKTGGAPLSDPVPECTFGNLTMKIGDELNSGTYYSSVCLKCVCEVPPIPTCQRLPDDECDVTVHAKFDNF